MTQHSTEQTHGRHTRHVQRMRRIVVVGAGVAGLAAARELLRLAPGAEVVVLERDARVGGLIETESTQDGFLVEHGPDSLLTWKPLNMQVVRELELSAALVSGTGVPRATFVAQGSELVPMPDGLLGGIPSAAMPLFRSPLLSVGAKLRMTAEPFMPRKTTSDDESVASFVSRRFGREVLTRLVDPLVSGIYGAPAERLSAKASIPQLVELERAHGSIAWGMRKTRGQRTARKTDDPLVVSLAGGMSTLTDTLAATLGPRVRLQAEVTKIEHKQGGGFRLQVSGAHLDTDALIVASPAHVAAVLLADIDAELAHALSGIVHGPLNAISMAFHKRDVAHPMQGTGFIVPSNQERFTTACSWMSQKWPGRAPQDRVLLRSFVQAEGATDADLVQLALHDLRELMGIEAAPEWTRIKRRARGLPRYEVGHGQRAIAMRERVAAHGPLAMAGNVWNGVGIPDCMQSGMLAAAEVLRALDARG